MRLGVRSCHQGSAGVRFMAVGTAATHPDHSRSRGQPVGAGRRSCAPGARPGAGPPPRAARRVPHAAERSRANTTSETPRPRQARATVRAAVRTQRLAGVRQRLANVPPRPAPAVSIELAFAVAAVLCRSPAGADVSHPASCAYSQRWPRCGSCRATCRSPCPRCSAAQNSTGTCPTLAPSSTGRRRTGREDPARARARRPLRAGPVWRGVGLRARARARRCGSGRAGAARRRGGHGDPAVGAGAVGRAGHLVGLRAAGRPAGLRSDPLPALGARRRRRRPARRRPRLPRRPRGAARRRCADRVRRGLRRGDARPPRHRPRARRPPQQAGGRDHRRGRRVVSARLVSPTLAAPRGSPTPGHARGPGHARPEQITSCCSPPSDPTLVRHFAATATGTVGWLPGIQLPVAGGRLLRLRALRRRRAHRLQGRPLASGASRIRPRWR